MSTDLTRSLLESWSGGDKRAMESLVAANLPWLQQHVRARLGGRLRQKMESMDVVQDAAIDALRYGPRFVLSDQRQFRALLGKMVENNLRDKDRRFRAQRRDQAREKNATESVLQLDAPQEKAPRPDRDAAAADLGDWMQLALEFLGEEERRIVILRRIEEKSFKEIAVELDMDADTVRMRFNRALPRLAERIMALRHGKLDSLFG